MAGGGSTRFGQDKARAVLSGKPLLLRMHALLSRVAGSAQIVAPERRYEDLGLPTIADRWPGEGPLGGILTALLHARENSRESARKNESGAEWNLILSCDMPFLTQDFLAYLLARAEQSAAPALVPESSHGREPLCACWRTSAVDAVQTAFDGGMRRVNDALKLLGAEVLDEAHGKRFDSTGRLFWNMNTPEDYREAQRILDAEHS